VEFVDALPLNRSAKVDKRALRDRYAAEHPADDAEHPADGPAGPQAGAGSDVAAGSGAGGPA
jgi:hypothetical protein